MNIISASFSKIEKGQYSRELFAISIKKKVYVYFELGLNLFEMSVIYSIFVTFEFLFLILYNL